MNKLFTSITQIVLAIIFSGSVIYSQTSDNNSSPTIAFVSDTQEPMLVEKLWLKSDNNKVATGAIFYALKKEENLSALFHLGDITPMGFWPGEWDDISKDFNSLQKSGVPVYPAMGNHEYFIFSSLGKKQFFKHFPQLKSSWYAQQIGETAVILLNSNFSELSSEEISLQQKWYEQKLNELDHDAAVRFIIVCTHHPPYTNSKVVEPSLEVQRKFVPAFLKSRKAMLFLSGHSHSFEHFRNGGKDFLVIGGGGGLLHPLHAGKDARFKDLYTGQRRTFHYVAIGVQKDSMVVRVKMLNPDYRSFSEVLKMEIGKLR